MKQSKLQDLRDKQNSRIDVHTHVGFDQYNYYAHLFPYVQNMRDLVAKTRLLGTEFLVTFPMALPTYYLGKKLIKNGILEVSGEEEFPYQEANQQLLLETELFGEAVLPVLAIHSREKVSEQENQILWWAKKHEIYGFKLHTYATQSKATELRDTPFLDIARVLGIPIIVHSASDDIANGMYTLEVASENEDIAFCICHLSEFSLDVLNEISRNNYPNVFLDTSPFLSLCYMATNDIHFSESGRFDRRPLD
ncbi:MAG: hypothetical protein ABIH55_01070 [Nanoarchaeota archaeon]